MPYVWRSICSTSLSWEELKTHQPNSASFHKGHPVVINSSCSIPFHLAIIYTTILSLISLFSYSLIQILHLSTSLLYHGCNCHWFCTTDASVSGPSSWRSPLSQWGWWGCEGEEEVWLFSREMGLQFLVSSLQIIRLSLSWTRVWLPEEW